MLLLLSIVLLAPGCRTARIHDVRDHRVPVADLELREEQIRRAARLQGWEVEVLRPGELIVTKKRGRHVAASTIEFTPDRYSITLRNSTDLKQSGNRIHKVYNRWIEGLDASIESEARAGSSARPSVAYPPPTPEE